MLCSAGNIGHPNILSKLRWVSNCHLDKNEQSANECQWTTIVAMTWVGMPIINLNALCIVIIGKFITVGLQNRDPKSVSPTQLNGQTL